jgi:hypothetical protein
VTATTASTTIERCRTAFAEKSRRWVYDSRVINSPRLLTTGK